MQLFVSHMKAFQPKLITLENDNISMPVFKEMIVNRIFNTGIIPSSKKNYDSSTHLDYQTPKSGEKKSAPIPIEKVRIFTFTGVEIHDEDEISMIENNAYLFVSIGISLILTQSR